MLHIEPLSPKELATYNEFLFTAERPFSGAALTLAFQRAVITNYLHLKENCDAWYRLKVEFCFYSFSYKHLVVIKKATTKDIKLLSYLAPLFNVLILVKDHRIFFFGERRNARFFQSFLMSHLRTRIKDDAFWQELKICVDNAWLSLDEKVCLSFLVYNKSLEDRFDAQFKTPQTIKTKTWDLSAIMLQSLHYTLPVSE